MVTTRIIAIDIRTLPFGEWALCIAATLMDFNLSVGGVSHWLDALPFDHAASTPEADRQRTRKRRASFRHSESRKRERRPISPPASQAARKASSLNPTPPAMAPSTPTKSPGKRPASDAPLVDTDQTPRVSKPSANKGPATSAPSLSSSQSGAAYSHDSKRSRRSSSLSMTAPSDPLSPALRDFLGDINDVAGRHCIMPQRIKATLAEHLAASGQHGMIGVTGEELVRRASHVAVRSSDCSRMLSDESAWNNLVQSPLLDMLLYDMRDGPGQEILDFLPCTTTSIDPAYHRFPDAANRVDYVLQLLPERDPDINKSCEALALGMAPAEAIDDLGFLPGVVVQGHTWSLVITVRRQASTIVLCSVEFGNTSSTVGVFQVLAGLRRLRSCSIDVMWPWCKQYLPGLSSPSSSGKQTCAAAVGEKTILGG
ncbi:unnamed protein product [Clonostachys chloroleuca]|uniref:PD-(D/E)XK nuclease-like domain-containing protein n=1 Tax=Clonostachys chloroleuca TaxID=1926264 RepID=A0AA35M1Q1_9HYPO|nr:unnamed protein product [Clonostachys chloroleuca]